MREIDPLRADFLRAMAQMANTVNIVTTDGPAGRFGVTVSAVTSVSADGPAPVLLACVHHLSPAAAAIAANGHFCVNVLRHTEAHVSDSFAGRHKLDDKFDCASWAACGSGAPRLADPLAAFDCAVMLNQRIGTHHIFFGAVGAIHFGAEGQPLIYAARSYGVPTALAGV